MFDVLLWMETSALGQFMRDVPWLFPTAEILHFTGLCLLMGSLLVMDFRLLGFSRDVPVIAVHKFIPIAAIGFGINLITGILFFFADPFRYYPNIAFRLKMLLILLSGFNALCFMLINRSQADQQVPNDTTWKIKLIAALSLLFWVSVIILGRLIPYVEY